jgi:hypothetical protein
MIHNESTKSAALVKAMVYEQRKEVEALEVDRRSEG